MYGQASPSARSQTRAAEPEAIVPAWSELPAAMQDALRGACQKRVLARDDTLLAEGARPVAVVCVARGSLGIFKDIEDGRSHMIGLLGPGDLTGVLGDQPADYRISALTETEILCFDRTVFDRAMQSAPAFEATAMASVLRAIDDAREWLLLLGKTRIAARVAALLLILHRRASSGPAHTPPEVHVPLRRSDLALFLGTRTETLSRAFHQLQDAGTIEIRDPNRFALCNLRALTETAGLDQPRPGG